ncbi:MAG: class I SAM-dependent methyltransferase [Pseudomonadota bacterium]
MSGFSSQWLDAREPIDHRARSEAVLAAVRQHFENFGTLKVTDIGCGTGSTLRALKPVLKNTLSWHLIDHDDTLLDQAKTYLQGDEMTFSLADLSKSVDTVFANQPQLLTTSAFLDLVSESWLKTFCEHVTQHQTPFYAALSYDGRVGCKPELQTDVEVLKAFNHHQKTDKGFGPALGPDAAETVIRLFENFGFKVVSDRSDWIGNPEDKLFQELLIEGWHQAACEIDPHKKAHFDSWLSQRLKLIDSGKASVFVGHIDFFAIPETMA